MINKIKNGANWLKLFTGARDRKYTILVICIKFYNLKIKVLKIILELVQFFGHI